MPVKLCGWVSAYHRLVEQTPMPLTHPSLEKLTNKALESHFPEEALWKRIDLLEQSAGLSESGVYGNLRRRAAERFVCAYGACGGKASEAVDEAAAALLIAPMAIRRRSNDEDAAQSAERILGEGCADACVRTAALCRRHT